MFESVEISTENTAKKHDTHDQKLTPNRKGDIPVRVIYMSSYLYGNIAQTVDAGLVQYDNFTFDYNIHMNKYILRRPH